MSDPFVVATSSDWYARFMKPVVEQLIASGVVVVADIGTGTGALPMLLSATKPDINVTATDVNGRYLQIAKERTNAPNINYIHTRKEAVLPMADGSADAVTICSLLFLLGIDERDCLIKEASRILRKGGQIVVLTPTGIGSFITTLRQMASFSPGGRWTYAVWKILTCNKGKRWLKEQYLKDYALKNNLQYTSRLVFNNCAIVEIITTSYY